MTVLLTGNPVDGLIFYGPFESAEHAADWAEGNCKNEEWWTADLVSVTER